MRTGTFITWLVPLPDSGLEYVAGGLIDPCAELRA